MWKREIVNHILRGQLDDHRSIHRDMQFAQESARLNAAMGSQLNDMMRNSVDPAATLGNQMRARAR